MRALAIATVALAAASTGSAFLLPAAGRRSTTAMRAESPSSSPQLARRDALSRSLGSAALAVLGVGLATGPGAAVRAAEEVPLVRDRMGGLLEPYTDIAKGLKLSRPSGWNQFDGTPDTYVVKWSDIINRDEVVVLNATPVKASTTSVTALGDVKEVGEKLAKARGAELVEAKERVTEGITFYEFEFKGEPVSELYELAVNKGRLWSLSATSATKRWAKRRDLLKNVLGSFLPKL